MMAKATQFSVSKSVKVNHGNYENTDFFMSATYDLGEEDNLHEQMDEAHILLNQAMMDALYTAFKVKKEKEVSRDRLACRYGLVVL